MRIGTGSGARIGANTAIFTVVNSVLLQPLRFPKPDQLVIVRERNLKAGFPQFSLSPGNYAGYRDANHTFSGIAAFGGQGMNMAGGAEPERLRGSMYFAIRTGHDPATLIAGIRAAIREIDSELPLDAVGTVDALVSTALSQRRFAMLLMSIFASLALTLAMVGIYGVIFYSVTQATQEIGIRMALGARRGDVLRMVFGYAGILMAAGLAIGIAGAMGAAC